MNRFFVIMCFVNLVNVSSTLKPRQIAKQERVEKYVRFFLWRGAGWVCVRKRAKKVSFLCYFLWTSKESKMPQREI